MVQTGGGVVTGPDNKAPVGLVRSEGDATQFLDELALDIETGAKTIEAFEGHELTTEELEQERHLCAALKRQASVELHPHGLRVQKWIPDGHGLGYHITARDRQQRRFDVEFKYETLERPEFAARSDLGRVIIDEVVQGLLKAKEMYQSRFDAARAELRATFGKLK